MVALDFEAEGCSWRSVVGVVVVFRRIDGEDARECFARLVLPLGVCCCCCGVELFPLCGDGSEGWTCWVVEERRPIAVDEDATLLLVLVTADTNACVPRGRDSS